MTPLQKAYALGQMMAKEAFEKQAQTLLGLGALGTAGGLGAGMAPQGERIGGGLGAAGGLLGGSKLHRVLRAAGLHPKWQGLAALTALTAAPYAGYRGGRAIERSIRHPKSRYLKVGSAFEERTAALFRPKEEWYHKITPEQWGALYETPTTKALAKKLGPAANWHPDMDLAVWQEAQKLYDPEFIAKQQESAKISAALGDPAFWQGGTPPPGAEVPTPAQTAEEAVQLLPAGTFQGAQIKITPDGQRSTTVKVTPDAVAQPDALANVFAAEPAAKVEISQPEQKGEGAGEELVPPEFATNAGKMAAAQALNLTPRLLKRLQLAREWVVDLAKHPTTWGVVGGTALGTAHRALRHD